MKFFDICTKALVPTNGIKLEVYEAGKGGIPIVLCHGWPELAFSWRHQIPTLIEMGFHCIVPNLRGYGNSSKPTEVDTYNAVNLSEDLNGLLDHYGLERAFFVGHDWGAWLLWHYALLHKNRVYGLINLSVPFRPRDLSDPIEFWEKVLGEDFYMVHFNKKPNLAVSSFNKNPERVLRNLYRTEHWLEDEKKDDSYNIIKSGDLDYNVGKLAMSDEEFKVFVDVFSRGGFEAPCNWYRNISRNWRLMEGVPQTIEINTLMIYGKYDMVPKVDMSESVKNLDIVTLDCGHWIQQEKPRETNEALSKWLNVQKVNYGFI